MPPLPALHIPVLAELVKQLRFAPGDALRRHIERAEALAEEIDPTSQYPTDWLVFRITGYRTDSTKPVLVDGMRVLGELAPFVIHLCSAARVQRDEWPDWPDAAALARTWNVSVKSLVRYRRLGLVARLVRNHRDKPTLIFSPTHAERFRARHAAALSQASDYSRIDSRGRDRVLRDAARYKRAGLTLNQAALRLAKRLGRSHETIRQVLKRHDRVSGHAIFSESGPISRKQAAMLTRAWRLGHDPAKLGQRIRKRPAAVLRAINGERTRELRAVELTAFDLDEGTISSVRIEAAASTFAAPPRTFGELVELARTIAPPKAPVELATARLYRVLLKEACDRIRSLPSSGASAPRLDAIETSLLWAARLKAELVRSELGVMLRAIESAIHMPLEHLRSGASLNLIQAGMAALGEAVEQFDGFGKGRLAGAAAVPLHRAIQAALKESELAAPARRATPRVDATLPLPDFTRRVASWQGWLEPHPRIRRACDAPDAAASEHVEILRQRFGLDRPPRTIEQLAQQHRKPLAVMTRLVRKSVRWALEREAG